MADRRPSEPIINRIPAVFMLLLICMLILTERADAGLRYLAVPEAGSFTEAGGFGAGNTKSLNGFTGIRKENGINYYYKNGKKFTGTRKADGISYYYKKGKKFTGTRKVNGINYYYRDGKKFTGTRKTGGVNYYYRDGKRFTGNRRVNGTGYYYRNGKRYTGSLSENGSICFYKNGIMQKGWHTIGGKTYYFKEDGGYLKNQIAGSKEEGYGFVDSAGVKDRSTAVQNAVNFVTAHSNAGQTPYQRLYSCYLVMSHFPYTGMAGAGESTEALQYYANQMFTYHTGNCYRFASAMAYIAKVLGFTSRVAVGAVFARMASHGWCEVLINDRWGICDCSVQMTHWGMNLFMLTRSSYPFPLRCDRVIGLL